MLYISAGWMGGGHQQGEGKRDLDGAKAVDTRTEDVCVDRPNGCWCKMWMMAIGCGCSSTPIELINDNG